MELRQQVFPLEVRALKAGEGDDALQGIITGYASTYQRDLLGTRMAPGAFTNSIATKRGRFPILVGHDPTRCIGFTRSIAEDHKGLLMEAGLALNTSGGRDAFELVRFAQTLDHHVGLSVGFNVVSRDEAREVFTEVQLIEVSLTVFAANEMARVEDARSMHGNLSEFMKAAIWQARLRLTTQKGESR